MLTERLGRAIKVAQWRNHREMEARLRGVGITLVQWDALRAIANLPAASGHDLAVATFQTDQSFGTLAGRLEAAGLITRQPGRGRRIEHHLTAAGRRLLNDGYHIVRTGLAELFSPLTDAERSQLLALLNKISPDGEPDPLLTNDQHPSGA